MGATARPLVGPGASGRSSVWGVKVVHGPALRVFRREQGEAGRDQSDELAGGIADVAAAEAASRYPVDFLRLADEVVDPRLRRTNELDVHVARDHSLIRRQRIRESVAKRVVGQHDERTDGEHAFFIGHGLRNRHRDLLAVGPVNVGDSEQLGDRDIGIALRMSGSWMVRMWRRHPVTVPAVASGSAPTGWPRSRWASRPR